MDLIAIAENTVKIILILGLPSLIVSMIIGLIISVFQAVTQISDASLRIVSRIVSFFKGSTKSIPVRVLYSFLASLCKCLIAPIYKESARL